MSSVLRLRRPDEDVIHAFLAAQKDEPFAYSEVGATRTGVAPRGYDTDRNQVRLGAGPEAFARACDALRRWAHFRLGWVDIHPPDAPLREGTTVSVLIRAAGLCWLNASRIVYVVEEDGPVRRFGFAYGTLAAHAERGEERFGLEWRAAEDGSVLYEILAFSRPNHPLARIGYPLVRLLQRRFARDSMRAMLAAVAP